MTSTETVFVGETKRHLLSKQTQKLKFE